MVPGFRISNESGSDGRRSSGTGGLEGFGEELRQAPNSFDAFLVNGTGASTDQREGENALSDQDKGLIAPPKQNAVGSGLGELEGFGKELAQAPSSLDAFFGSGLGSTASRTTGLDQALQTPVPGSVAPSQQSTVGSGVGSLEGFGEELTQAPASQDAFLGNGSLAQDRASETRESVLGNGPGSALPQKAGSNGSAGLEGLGGESTQAPGSLDAFLGHSLPGQVRTSDVGASPRKSPPGGGGGNGRFAAAFASPLVVGAELSGGAGKLSADVLTPQSTLHSAAPPLFPDPDFLGDGPATKALKPTSESEPLGGLPVGQSEPASEAESQASERGSQTSATNPPVKFGVKEAGRLSASMFGEESDEETELAEPVPAVVSKAASQAPSLEALLNSSAYEASIANASGGGVIAENGAPPVGSSNVDASKLDTSPGPDATSLDALFASEEGEHVGPATESQPAGHLSPPLESLGSFSFGPVTAAPSVMTTQGAVGFDSGTPSGGAPVTRGTAGGAHPHDDDDDFGDFESADMVGGPDPRTAGGVPLGGGSLEDALFGGFDLPQASERSSDGVFPGSEEVLKSNVAAVAERSDPFVGPELTSFAAALDVSERFRRSGKQDAGAASKQDDLFGGFEAREIGAVAPGSVDEDDFGEFVDSRRESVATTSASADDPFGGFENSRRNSAARASMPEDDFFGGVQLSARTSVSAALDDPFGGFEGLGMSSAARGSEAGTDPFGGVGGIRKDSTKAAGGGVLIGNLGGAKIHSPGSSARSSGFETLGGFESLPSGRASSGAQSGGLDLDFLSGPVSQNPIKPNPPSDPFLDLMGLDASVPSTSGQLSDLLGAPGGLETQGLATGLGSVSGPRRSVSLRRERRERSRRSSSASEGVRTEPESVRTEQERAQNGGGHSRAASWQGGNPQSLERTAGSVGSGKRKSYKESDLLEVAIELLEEGRLAEARACWAHIGAQRGLPERKVGDSVV